MTCKRGWWDLWTLVLLYSRCVDNFAFSISQWSHAAPRVYLLKVRIIEEEKQTEEKAKVITIVWGTETIQFHAALQIQHQDDLKKKINRRKDVWQNGCFRKMDYLLVHTKPNPLLPNGSSSKNVLQIILAANWLVGHSIPSPKQQRRPLPSFLSVYSSMVRIILRFGDLHADIESKFPPPDS